MTDRRRSEWKVLATPSLEDLLEEEIDGVKYGYHYTVKCRVCRAPLEIRNLIDSLLLAPETYAETLRRIAPFQQKYGLVDTKDEIYYDSIRLHQKNHLPFDKLAIRELAERKAREKGQDIVNGAQNLLNNELILELIVKRGWDALVEGSLSPDMNGLLNAIQLQSKLEKEADSEVSQQEILTRLNMVILAVKEVVSEDQLQQISDRIQEMQEVQGQLQSAQ